MLQLCACKSFCAQELAQNKTAFYFFFIWQTAVCVVRFDNFTHTRAFSFFFGENIVHIYKKNIYRVYSFYI